MNRKRRDPFTHLEIPIPRAAKPWVPIIAWLVFMGVFVYAIIKAAEHFEGKMKWP